MSTAERLITEAEARAKAYCPTDPDTARAYELGLMRALLHEKCAELAVFTGEDKVRRNVSTVYAADAPVLVVYDYQRAEEPVYDVESPVCGPGHDAAVTLTEALINGAWIDPREVFDEGIVERWEQQLLQQLEEA